MSLIYLPPPQKLSTMTVEEAILSRRSIREFKEDPIRLEHLSMILWAAYGITDPNRGFRASPSAGATYPLELYIVVGEGGVYISNNTYLDPGIYKYNPYVHGLTNIKKGDFRKELMKASLYQKWVENAPVSIVICAVYDRTTRYYGERGRTRYVPIDVGHVGQNIYLMATALGYGTVAIGAFKDSEVSKVIDVKTDETPLYIMPIGVPKSKTLISFNDIKLFLNKSR
uniref:SagB/ThcOx family dehydrogenase n=1 Tax=Ignisphaera aggregans TaxID=334771 RepID=A0A7C5UTF0_9CREN